jgi:hypothetical protein
MTETKTHDYTRRVWGHDFIVTQLMDDGWKLSLTGWGRGISEGDFIILPNARTTTRYRIASIEYCMNPTDMWNATAEFAPRLAQYRPKRKKNRLAADVAQAAQ